MYLLKQSEVQVGKASLARPCLLKLIWEVSGLEKKTMHVQILQTSLSLKGVSLYLLVRPHCSTSRNFVCDTLS